jgi:anhydro-N-acetylmuramic acid kinase
VIALLQALLDKPERLAIGLMSGTSMDGIDAALVRIAGCGAQTRVRLEAFTCQPYEQDLVDRLLPLASGESATALEWARLDHHIAQSFARAALALTETAAIDIATVDFLASHGQTLAHHAGFARWDPLATTWQAGNANVLAALTGRPVVADFRSADVALGGTGAPLVPVVDWLLHRSASEDRVVLNLGGIANLTWLPAAAALEATQAWDIGPANMLLDALARELLDRPHDDAGRVAARGSADAAWVDILLQDDWFVARPPKAAGREQFGRQYVAAFRNEARQRHMSIEDQMATAVELTVQAVARSLQWLPESSRRVVYVTGGGRHNDTVMQRLHEVLPCRVAGLDELGVRIDAKEAVDFAVLGNEALHGHAANLTQVTGAQRPVVSGCLALAGFPPQAIGPTREAAR